MNRNNFDEMIRVDHAGETGAVDIYAGQIAALKIRNDKETLHIVEEMKEQEIIHCQYFSSQLLDKRVRPTILSPFWRIGGFALGFMTAIAGKKTAMICTAAVEEIIDQHYKSQIKNLENLKKNLSEDNQRLKNKLEKKLDEASFKSRNRDLEVLKQNIVKFREDEIVHRDIAYENLATDSLKFKPLSLAIKGITRLAIMFSKKL